LALSIRFKIWSITGLAGLLALTVIIVGGTGVFRANIALVDLKEGALSALEQSNQKTQKLLLIQNDLLTYAFRQLINADDAELKPMEDALLAEIGSLDVDSLGSFSEKKLADYLEHVRNSLILARRNPRIGFMSVAGTTVRFDELIRAHQAQLAIDQERARQETRTVITHGENTILAILTVAVSLGTLILFLTAVFSQSMITSIRRLTSSMKALAADDLTTEIPDLHRRDELGQMAETVGVFKAGAIKRREVEKDLADYRQHLEDLVDERTSEIERQKVQVEEALFRERELNGLQRQFVAMVSHEFRTPLAIIDGNAQRLLRRADQVRPERLRTILGTVRRSVGHLVELMESVLAAARLESGQIEMQPSHFSLSDLVREVSGSYAELHRDRRIVLDIEALPDQLFADAKLIRQVVSNIISNAIKYSPDEGRIWIGGFVDDAGRAVLSVRDEGVGIPLAEQEKLFERFFRASTSTGIAGSGIGLHLAAHLVQMHGGVIDVESAEGEGATFFIRLPVTRPAAGADVPDSMPDEAPNGALAATA
jgi:signal transduction histidine kinase